MLARRRAEAEQALLDLLQASRLEREIAPHRLDFGRRLEGLGRGPGEGAERPVEAAGGMAGDLFQRPLGRPQSLRRAALALERGTGLGHRLAELLGVDQKSARLGQGLLLAGLGSQRLELAGDMAQVVLLGAGRGEPGRGGLDRLRRLAQPRPGLAHGRVLVFEPAEGIEQGAVPGGIEKRGVIPRTMDLDQGLANAAQQVDAHRLVVEIGAASTLAVKHPAQDHDLAFPEAVLLQEPPRGVPGGHLELGAYRGPVSAVTHQRAAAAAAEGEPQSIEQDRFAGAGLAGKDVEARSQAQIEPVDEDDVPNGEPEQHRRLASSGGPGREAPQPDLRTRPSRLG